MERERDEWSPVNIYMLLKELRKYRGHTQTQYAKLLGIDQSLYAKKEKGLAGGLTIDRLSRIVRHVDIDVRWLFGQMQGDIQQADLRLREPDKSLTQQLVEEVQELRKRTRPLKDMDPLAEKILTDVELRRLVEKLLVRRQYFGRIEGYVDGLVDEEKGGEKQAREA